VRDKHLLFNGVDFDRNDYFHRPMGLEAFHDRLPGPNLAQGPGQLAKRSLASWADPAKLRQTGWGVAVHEREDPAVLESLAPLLALRREQAGDRFHRFTLTDEDLARDDSEKMAARFLARMNHGAGGVDPGKLPYYLLVVGSPERIPFRFQYGMDLAFAVGRLAFEKPEAYAAYARNVVAGETAPAAKPRRLTLFGPRNDALTEDSVRFLLQPIAARLRELEKNRASGEPWRIEEIVGDDAVKARLVRLMGGDEAPALLFTASHGICFSKDVVRLRREQGGLICSDWTGPGAKITPDHYYSALDVSDQADFRGMVAVHFACFSAGTPELDNFDRGDAPFRWGHAPLIANLPQRLLSHERGPLAVIGHVDQTFQHSFLWDERVNDITHFVDLFYRLMAGKPAGWAMDVFNRRFASVSAQILETIMRQGPSRETQLRHWMAYHDARNYFLLGDPAVSLT